MKKSIILLLFFMALGYQSSIQAKNSFSDSIWVKLNSGILLRLVGNDFDHQFPEKMDFAASLASFLSSWKELKMKEINQTNRMEIFFERKITSNQIRISESHSFKRVYLLAPKDSFKFSVPPFNILDINLHRIQIRLYFSDIKQLKEAKEFKTDSLFELLKKNVESSKSIYPVNRWYIFTPERELYLVHTERSNSNQNDLVLIGLGTDIQLVKRTWAPGLSGSLSIVFCRKLIQRNKYSFLYSGIYDFSNNNLPRNDINHFIGVGYSHNFADSPGYLSWYGVNFSYLVKNSGSLFDKNTFCIALVKNFTGHLDMQPTIYFNDFLKNIYPSIKMSVHF